MSRERSLGQLIGEKYEQCIENPACSDEVIDRRGRVTKQVYCRTERRGLSAILWPQKESWALRLTSAKGAFRLPLTPSTQLDSDPVTIIAERTNETVWIAPKDQLIEAPPITINALCRLVRRLRPYEKRASSLTLDRSLDVSYVLHHDEHGKELAPLSEVVGGLFREAHLAQAISDESYIQTNFDYVEGCGVAEEIRAQSAQWRSTLVMPLDTPTEPFMQLQRTDHHPLLVWTNDGTFPAEQGNFLIEDTQVFVPVDETVVQSGLSELNPQGLLFLRHVLEEIRPIPYIES